MAKGAVVVRSTKPQAHDAASIAVTRFVMDSTFVYRGGAAIRILTPVMASPSATRVARGVRVSVSLR